MTAHAIDSSGNTPPSVRVLKNIDVVALAVALVVFVAAGLPIAGWLTGAGAWAIQRLINEFAIRKAEASSDPRTRVGLLAGTMILRGWIVALIIVAVGLGNNEAGLSAAILFLVVFTLQFTMTMAMRPYETRGGKSQ